jgi:hypothetical protein
MRNTLMETTKQWYAEHTDGNCRGQAIVIIQKRTKITKDAATSSLQPLFYCNLQEWSATYKFIKHLNYLREYYFN